MNDTFSLRRFGWLFRKTLLERPVQLAGLMGLTMALSFLSYATFKTVLDYETAQNLSFCFGLVGGGSFLASFVFNYFSSNAIGSSYLTLPASHFERWLCGVVITGVLFVFLFLVFFRLVDSSFVFLYHQSLDPKGTNYRELYDAVHRLPLDGFVAGKVYIMFLNCTGAMLIGSLYFNKAPFIKVALICCALFLGSYFVDYLMAKAIFDNVDKALPYYAVFIPAGNDFGKVTLPPYASAAIDICMIYIVPAILWITAYVRLREKEF